VDTKHGLISFLALLFTTPTGLPPLPAAAGQPPAWRWARTHTPAHLRARIPTAHHHCFSHAPYTLHTARTAAATRTAPLGCRDVRRCPPTAPLPRTPRTRTQHAPALCRTPRAYRRTRVDRAPPARFWFSLGLPDPYSLPAAQHALTCLPSTQTHTPQGGATGPQVPCPYTILPLPTTLAHTCTHTPCHLHFGCPHPHPPHCYVWFGVTDLKARSDRLRRCSNSIRCYFAYTTYLDNI